MAMKLKVGDLVMPNLKGLSRHLFLWSGEEDDKSTVVAKVEAETILTVIKIEKLNKGNLNPEWKDTSCMLLGPNGAAGWAGSGWIKVLPSRTNPKCKTVRY